MCRENSPPSGLFRNEDVLKQLSPDSAKLGEYLVGPAETKGKLPGVAEEAANLRRLALQGSGYWRGYSRG
jgi:hypothetical protein